MPLLEIKPGAPHLCASVRLDEATAAQVDQYAAFIHPSADDVVEKALNHVFAKDRDFQDFLKSAHAKQVAPALRVRKGPSNGPTGTADKEAWDRGGVSDFCTRGEGMIGLLISWQCKNGASHRKNFDIPPLARALQSAFSALGLLVEFKPLLKPRALWGALGLPEQEMLCYQIQRIFSAKAREGTPRSLFPVAPGTIASLEVVKDSSVKLRSCSE